MICASVSLHGKGAQKQPTNDVADVGQRNDFKQEAGSAPGVNAPWLADTKHHNSV